jgi:hypothetical protein
MRKSIKELRFITTTKDIDVSGCLEKSDIVNNIINCLNKEKDSISDMVETIDETIYRVESDIFSDEYSDGDDESYEEIEKRAHRRTKDPSRQKCNMSMWQSVEKSFVESLPPDIDGLVAYRLAFNPKQRMKSSTMGNLGNIWKNCAFQWWIQM